MSIDPSTTPVPPGDRTETDAAFQHGLAVSKPRPLADDGDARFSVLTVPAGASHVVLDREQLEEYGADAPRRKKGRYAVHTAHSFCEFVAKHGDGAEVWADEVNQALVGVLNAHGAGPAPAWEDHRVALELVTTPAWKAWKAVDGQLLPQVEFAELIDARVIDIASPSGADMLEIAESFHATIGVQFKSSKVLASGERQLQYVEDVNATAGRNESIEIPKDITLRICPFVGSAPREIKARFRYRINAGHLHLGVVLERPEDVLQDAFTECVTAVTTELPDGVPVYYGRPA